MAVWSTVPFSEAFRADRIDPDYYQPRFLELEQQIEASGLEVVPLGNLVQKGYRVVYESTTILGEPFDQARHAYFLQAADIPSRFPVIDFARMGWVDRSDWLRYPKGRAEPGELLIEVKGRAEKVVLVPDDFDLDMLVTGTLYKMTLDEKRVDPRYAFIYLISEVGRTLRDRLKSNIMVPYVNKGELYGLSVALPSMGEQEAIGDLLSQAEGREAESKARYADAEALLAAALGLDTLTLPAAKTYTASFGDVATAERLDAEHFRPQIRASRDHVVNRFGGQPLSSFATVTKGKTPKGYTEEGIPVVRSGDLVDLDDTSGLLRADPEDVRFYLKSGDVLISSIGFGSIGKVQVFDHATPHTTVSEVTVIRQNHLNPYFLKAFLSSPLGQLQIESWVTGATGQLHLRPADVEKIVVPILPAADQEAFEQLYREARTLKDEAASLLEEAKERVEALVLGA